MKVWKQLLLTWHKRILRIRENDFEIIKQSKFRGTESHLYSLLDAVLVDQSKQDDLRLLIGTSNYKVYIRPETSEDSAKIIGRLQEIIKKYSSQKAFSSDYQKYNEEMESCVDDSPYGIVVRKLNMFQNVMIEMTQKIDDFRTMIQNKHAGNTINYMSMYQTFVSIREEMKKQFDEIVASVYNYHDLVEDKNKVLNKKKYKYTGNERKDGDISSEEEKELENLDVDIEHNINIESENQNKTSQTKEIKKEDISKKIAIIRRNSLKDPKKNPYYFMGYNEEEFFDEKFNFAKRENLPQKITYPKDIVKEMLNTFTKQQPSPVFFNEPLSMGQKQCEKFQNIDLLIKAGQEEKKEMQMCYIAAFIVGEIFLNLKRTLKPFSPIYGETYEYIDNEKKFRYISEQVSHDPQITAYIGETPEFAYYGDTLSSTSFKIFKGALEILFKNKIHVHIKKTGDHYIFNPPSILLKGIMKNSIYNDYSGTTVIQNTKDTSYRCELKFNEESWTPNSLGGFEGTVFKDYETIVYLLKGNWKSEIYMTDPEGNNRADLLKLDNEAEYLNNSSDSYVIPKYSCNLNYLTPELKSKLPPNDSRFRQDIRLMENGPADVTKAQSFKEKYEEKQRKELLDVQHTILYFSEFVSPETEDKYYIPNGKYWEDKQNGNLVNNCNSEIFDISKY